MTRKPAFWIAFATVSAAATAATVIWFDRAFPIVSLDLQMDRSTALTRAAELASQLNLGPEDYAQAASFTNDQAVQNYVELEAGGTQAFAALIRSGLYPPYRWVVRHFREGEITECQFLFSPEGRPFGFRLTLPEAEPGAQLEPDAARALADAELGRWGIQRDQWHLVEETTETRTGGRRDHQFVYEHAGLRLGEARYRFAITVAGDRVSRAEPFIRLPEAFGRRYQEMRSSNQTIALAASLVVGVIYLVGGCGTGLLILLRLRSALWRPALAWGAVIGGLQFLTGLNQYPLAWMEYDTALSSGQFLVRWVLESLGEGLAVGLLLSLVFLVAEGMSRQAFPHHLQLWKLWSRQAGSSRPVLGRTLAGFLLVPVFFAYETALYFVTRSRLGWWTPSDSLIHPDTLATFLPWLNPIAISAQAGFGEECLFRAVPLAGAALLGRRFGGKAWWIAAALGIQALVFGAGHAGYANQPAYARVVELILPSLMFGALYLVYGLLPAVILHFVFDVVWFALPIFLSSTGTARLDQTLVVLLTLSPLGVVLYRGWQAGAWTEAPDTVRNSAWQPPPPPEPLSGPMAETPPRGAVGRALRVTLAASGLAGVVAVAGLRESPQGVPPLTLQRAEAEGAARRFLESVGDPLLRSLAGPDWRLLSRVEANAGQAERFVWETSGPETFRSLLGTYLKPPVWLVRVVRLEGPTEERAEELQVRLDPDGGVRRVTHILPEHRPGPKLERGEILALAEQEARRRWGELTALRLVSVEPSELPERRDWLVVFADDSRELAAGEARIRIRLSGDRVADSDRFVYVPEDWMREDRSRRQLLQILGGAGSLLVYLFLLGGAVAGIAAWSRKSFHFRAALGIGGLAAVLGLARAANQWPAVLSLLDTAEPYSHQVGAWGAILVVGAVLPAVLYALVSGLVYSRFPVLAPQAAAVPLRMGWWLAGAVAGVLAVIHGLGAGAAPPWPDFSGADHVWPAATVALGSLSRYLAHGLFLLLVLLTAAWIRGRQAPVRRVLFLLVIGAAVGAGTELSSLVHLALAVPLAGLALALLEEILSRVGWAAAPMPAAVPAVLGLLGPLVENPFPGARAGGAAGILLVGLAAWGWVRWNVRTGGMLAGQPAVGEVNGL
jgi:hypothetical protein